MRIDKLGIGEMKKELVTEDGIAYKKPEMSKKDKKHSVLYMLPSLLGVLLFFLLPFAVVIYYALVDNPINHKFVGFENFVRIIQNSSFQQAAKNTATFSLVAVPLAVILSLVMALILEENIPMKSQFRTFFLSPMMVPVASIVLIWQVLFDYNGAINEFIKGLGGNSIDWFKSSYSQIVIVILFLWKNLGYNMILFMSALNAIPRDVLEVATLESASEFQKFWYIKLRYLSSTILFVAILSLINSFKVFREVYLLTGDYPYDSLYMLQHFMNNTFKSLDYQKLSAAAIIMGIVMCVVIGCLFFAEDRYGKDVEG
jgi:multiple sugar transport system permease protein